MATYKVSLAAARVNADMTQKEVADYLGVSNKTVCNWENGDSIPTKATLLALCDLYKAPIEYIFLPDKTT